MKVDPVTAFIKQYGEKRTGTNLLRALLVTHFSDVCVLMHVLGGKHLPPAPFTAIHERVRESGAAIGEFTIRSTLARPADTIRADDASRSSFISALSAPVAESFQRGELFFLISIKHPYSWFSSVRRFALLDEFSPAPTAREACRRFNRNYRSWIALRSEFGQRVAVVRFEDLLADPDSTLMALARRFRLHQQAATPVTLPAEIVVPTRWDHMTTRTADGVRFCPERYVPDRYAEKLGAAELRELSSGIDWDLIAEFGYRPGGWQ
jgi:hypothetical protein